MKMHPSLVRQLVDPSHVSLSAGSNTSVPWRCDTDPRHVWNASPNTRRRSPGCPVCQNKIVIAGVNDLETTDPDIAGQLHDPATSRLVHRGSHKKVDWTCGDPLHVWTASVVSRVRLKAGCPFCSGRRPVVGVDDLATTHPEIAEQLVDPDQARTVGAGSAKKLEWRCSADPDHTWTTQVRYRAQKGTGCPRCAPRRTWSPKRNPTIGESRLDLLADAADPDAVVNLSTGSGHNALWWCRTCPEQHTYTMTVKKQVQGQRCPVSAGTQVVPGVNDLATTHPHLVNQLVDPEQAHRLSRGSTVMETWCCENGHEWTAPVYARVAGNGCKRCSGRGTSKAEVEIVESMRDLLPDKDITQHNQQMLNGRHELDIVVPSLRLAVEFNGLYWHSEACRRPNSYHQDKSRVTAEAGYQLIHIWEDDWRDQREVVIRTLAHKMSATSRLLEVLPEADPRIAQTVYARVLTPGEAHGIEARTFLEKNHIQGAVSATRHLVLREADNSIRALLSLRSARHNARMRRSTGDWEIQRYATLGNVPGGFTRLLTHARRTLQNEGLDLTRWISFSADDISDGGMYQAAGFNPEKKLRADYRYVGPLTGWTRRPKEKFQRKTFRDNPDLLWDESWTEHEAALANGLYRIYDAGKTRWVKDIV